jgi:cytidylate kinase
MTSRIEEFRGDHEKQSNIIICIDGPSGAGKGTLAEMIAEELDVNHFSASDVFYMIAEEKGLTGLELSEQADKEVDLQIDRRTLKKALKEDCVVDGRITAWVLGDYADLSIYLTADEDERGRRVAEREDEEIEKAVEDTRKRDRENKRRYREYYGIDTSDRSIYDVLMDNTDMSLEEERKELEKLLRKQNMIQGGA